MTDNQIANFQENFHQNYQEFLNATDLTRPEKANKLISQIDVLGMTAEGIALLYDHVGDMEKAGIFNNTVWQEPQKLVPSLVKGTLISGHPTSSYELVSELRLLAYAEGNISSPQLSQGEAATFLEEVLVHNLEFVFQEPTEETRTSMSEHELKKAGHLFRFILDHSRLEGIKEKLAEEVNLICEQRPVVTRPAREIIRLIRQKVELNLALESDRVLKKYVDAVYAPSECSLKYPEYDAYRRFLQEADAETLEKEAAQVGASMRTTGLVSGYNALILIHLTQQELDDIIPATMQLSATGEAEWHAHKKFLKRLVLEVCHSHNNQFIYGLAKMLEKGMFSRQAVRAGLDNLRHIRLDSHVEEAINKSIVEQHPEVTALQYLIGALIRILGQPLGVGQGNNPTCQSARGISMWSQHSPAKLINMVITAATQGDLVLRFEGKELKASLLGKGLVEKLDYNLDAVSVILVPKLDRIYNEMMRLASGRGEDPHKWVNPAMYGQWVPVGFASSYTYLYNAIQDYDGFIRIFYASFHPRYNHQRRLVYPNPIGIYVTSSKGKMLGFHAISLLRVRKDPEGHLRAYFLNPNNEGRQNWGQGIKPSVFGHGEKRGESSLPFHEFASRVYAFHFNNLELDDQVDKIPVEEIKQVRDLAQSSWGEAYIWSEIKKQW